MADEDTPEVEEPKKGGKGKMIIFGVIGLALVGGGMFAKPMIMNMINPPEPTEEELASEPEVTKLATHYYPILPPLTTNFSDDAGRRRFMQVSLEVVALENSAIDAVKDHNAVIRNALLMAFSDVRYEDAITREGKEALRQLSLQEVQAVLESKIGEPGIEDIFFTAFVIQ